MLATPGGLTGRQEQGVGHPETLSLFLPSLAGRGGKLCGGLGNQRCLEDRSVLGFA